MRLLLRYGPARGYFPCPAKSILIDAPPEDSPGGRLLAEFSFEAPAGSRYLGGFLGKGTARESWVGEKVAAWTESVRDLARVAVRHPQAALAGLTRSLQQEWLFVQRVVPGIRTAFAPIEEAIAGEFIPALVGDPSVDCRALRRLMALPVKRGGDGAPKPRHDGGPVVLDIGRGDADLDGGPDEGRPGGV